MGNLGDDDDGHEADSTTSSVQSNGRTVSTGTGSSRSRSGGNHVPPHEVDTIMVPVPGRVETSHSHQNNEEEEEEEQLLEGVSLVQEVLHQRAQAEALGSESMKDLSRQMKDEKAVSKEEEEEWQRRRGFLEEEAVECKQQEPTTRTTSSTGRTTSDICDPSSVRVAILNHNQKGTRGLEGETGSAIDVCDPSAIRMAIIQQNNKNANTNSNSQFDFSLPGAFAVANSPTNDNGNIAASNSHNPENIQPNISLPNTRREDHSSHTQNPAQDLEIGGILDSSFQQDLSHQEEGMVEARPVSPEDSTDIRDLPQAQAQRETATPHHESSKGFFFFCNRKMFGMAFALGAVAVAVAVAISLSVAGKQGSDQSSNNEHSNNNNNSSTISVVVDPNFARLNYNTCH